MPENLEEYEKYKRNKYEVILCITNLSRGQVICSRGQSAVELHRGASKHSWDKTTVRLLRRREERELHH